MSDVKVGDRVRVVHEFAGGGWSGYDGKMGVVLAVDVGDTYPYDVKVDGEECTVWMHEVERLESAPTDRESLVTRAKSLLAGTEHTGADVIAMAAFLAG